MKRCPTCGCGLSEDFTAAKKLFDDIEKTGPPVPRPPPLPPSSDGDVHYVGPGKGFVLTLFVLSGVAAVALYLLCALTACGGVK